MRVFDIKERADLNSYNRKAIAKGIVLNNRNYDIFWEVVDWDDDDVMRRACCDEQDVKFIQEELLLFIASCNKMLSSVFEAWVLFEKHIER